LDLDGMLLAGKNYYNKFHGSSLPVYFASQLLVITSHALDYGSNRY